MMLCIAESIIKYKDIVPDAVARNFKEWYNSSPIDIGATTAIILSLFEYDESPYEIAQMMWERTGRNNAANGGVMRTSIVGLWNETVAENAESMQADSCRPKMYWLLCHNIRTHKFFGLARYGTVLCRTSTNRG